MSRTSAAKPVQITSKIDKTDLKTWPWMEMWVAEKILHLLLFQ
jgi:hypothetical protein